MVEITTIIATYNREKSIKESIESVLNQKNIATKVIVVDDGSTDNTKNIINKLAKDYSNRITYIKTDNNGPAVARNIGVSHAQTEWIAFNDSDDSWHDDKLTKQYEYLLSHPANDLIYCGYRGYHEDNDIITTSPDRDLPYK